MTMIELFTFIVAGHPLNVLHFTDLSADHEGKQSYLTQSKPVALGARKHPPRGWRVSLFHSVKPRHRCQLL